MTNYIEEMDTNIPFVSIVTPTYNRRRFIPYLIRCYEQQTYRKDRMEWIILDDGQDKVGDLFAEAAKRLPNIRYIALEEKETVPAKRNRLNQEAKGSIIIAMDDDDYYPPERVSHVVTKFKANPKIQVAGASEIYMYYTDLKLIVRLGPYSPTHATNGTMAWRSSYAMSHSYDETVTHSEERSFLDDYIHPMIQLDPFKTMLVISHTENTFGKKALLENENPFVKKTSMKIRDFVKDKVLRDFYTSA